MTTPTNSHFSNFFRRFLAYFAGALLLAGAFPAAAQTSADGLRPNVDYIVLDPPLPVRAPEGKIEVLEFFNFSCPHCFRMQTPIANWQKEEKKLERTDAVLIHQPVIFQSHGGHYARAFHTMEALGLGDALFRKFFNAIHRERVLLNSRDRLAAWLEEKHGVEADKAAKIYDSFSVNAKIARDQRITQEYGVNSTPHMAVAGKYLMSPATSGSLERMMQIATLLIERERQLLAKKADKTE